MLVSTSLISSRVGFGFRSSSQVRMSAAAGALYALCTIPAAIHGLLHIVEFASIQQALGGADLRALGLIEQDEVRIFELAVEDDGIAAGKALCVVAVADAAVTGMVQKHHAVLRWVRRGGSPLRR